MTIYAHPTLGMSDSIPVSATRVGQVITQQAHLFCPLADTPLTVADVIRLLKIPARHRIIDLLAFADGFDNDDAITCYIRQWSADDVMLLSTSGIDLMQGSNTGAYDWRGEEVDRVQVMGAFADNASSGITDVDSYVDVVIGVAPTAQTSGTIGVVVAYTPYDNRNCADFTDPKNPVVFA